MALKDWLDTGKCLVGFHEGNWLPRKSRSCVLLQTCARCKNISRRVEHDWAEWRYPRRQTATWRDRASAARNKKHGWSTNGTLGLTAGDKPANRAFRVPLFGVGRTEPFEHDWDMREYHEQYRAPLHRCAVVRCWLRISPINNRFDGRGDGNDEISPAKVPESLSDDQAIEEMLQRAQAQAAVPRRRLQRKEVFRRRYRVARARDQELRQMYEEQSRAGVIAPERKPLLNAILAELDDVIANPLPAWQKRDSTPGAFKTPWPVSAKPFSIRAGNAARKTRRENTASIDRPPSRRAVHVFR